MKILFVNPAIKECGVPHTGFAMLDTILIQRGHTVRIADYHFSSQTPKVEKILEDFKPDVVGISLLSCTASIVDNIIKAVKNRNIPLLCGGPHTASYYDELSTDSQFDFIVIGEAENIIAELIERAKTNEMPEVIHCPLPEVNVLPFPTYTSFYNYENIKVYPIITSRGCPFNCSFCSIGISNSKVWRPRSAENCIEELKKIRLELPSVKSVMIWDDNFSLDITRAKFFLQLYLKERFEYKLNLANVRADKIDKEFLSLLKRAGCEEVQFGVEHGNPEVFRHVEKGETLEDIRRAAKLVNEYGMKLGCSFIIGLPYDTLKKTFDSIKFAKELKADHIHWNILVPYKGTKAYEYFKENGRIDDDIIPFTIPHDPLLLESNAETPYFTVKERKKAYLMALLLSGDGLLFQNIRGIFYKVLKNNLIKEFLWWLVSPKILKGLVLVIKEHIFRCKK